MEGKETDITAFLLCLKVIVSAGACLGGPGVVEIQEEGSFMRGMFVHCLSPVQSPVPFTIGPRAPILSFFDPLPHTRDCSFVWYHRDVPPVPAPVGAAEGEGVVLVSGGLCCLGEIQVSPINGQGSWSSWVRALGPCRRGHGENRER